ncbi:wax ester/triacylglycerol synthase family O-acyltransferase [Halieaceae bacterium IMCC14734]|uniref:diacylglycerol O-acyltransferase n=1 Tax=Candidatus Litorirhabdus singularis TaxID=2518993 RepID=A0ABT3TI64_9GAMM|nr:wax ester/triacylglycerol synthase family O-acyltransferase [Candidatus Litorirhabdus singularis]MCX2982012.1 wax ester/triacylglycerol synthase family O-acyltransferase [Candidatus Litorirhabdus singularis]
MYRLHGQDAAWLYRETLTTPMHTLKIFLVRLGEDAVLDFDSVHASIPRLLHEVPMLRQRPVFVPFGLHHPVMIEDPEFDLDYHLNRAALPAPGGQAELEDVIAHIASHPLDQTRPLWQFWVIEGLQDGRIALVQKIHHTLADGMASVNFIMRVWQSGYHQPDSVAPAWQPEAIPSKGRLFWDAVYDHIKYDIGNLPSFFRALYRGSLAIKKVADPATSPTLMSINGDLPQAPWNRALSSRRSFAMAQFDLDRLKTLKSQLQGTLNDVVLGMVAGSLRAYLQQHDQPFNEALLATIPVSREPGASDRESGNSTAVTTTLLHIQIDDPVTRYEAIRATSEIGKAELEVVGRDTFGLMAHYVPPLIQQATAHRAYTHQDADKPGYRPPANLSVSNVPGPRTQFEALGNVVEDLYSAGPLVEGIGLNITLWSYAGHVNFTMVGCMKLLPDVQLIADGLEQALLELEAATKAAG